MTHRLWTRPLAVTLALLAAVPPVGAQIFSNAGDGVLHAPYCGTVASLRKATMPVGYGEVMNHTEPRYGALTLSSNTVTLSAVAGWDRSVLRLYRGLDASGSEVDLSSGPVEVTADFQPFLRLSLKAIAVNTLAPQRFLVRFEYQANGLPVEVTRPFVVAATTGSFISLPGLSEAFQLGTPLLDVSVGNARLTVPVGRTAEMIGAAFIRREEYSAADT